MTDQISDQMLGMRKRRAVEEMLVSLSMWPLLQCERMPLLQYRVLIERPLWSVPQHQLQS